MSDKIYTPTEHFIRIGTRAIIALLIVAVAGAIGLGAIIVRGSSWLYNQYGRNNRGNNVQGNNQGSGGNASIVNPITSLKNLFSPSPAGQNSNQQNIVQPVKVISEESAVIDAVKKNSPAVVSIVAAAEVPKLERCYQNLGPGVSDLPPEFQQFFGGNLQVPGLCQKGTQLERVSAGSGFLVSADGFIVTNKHVVADDKAEYTAILNDSRHFGQKVPATVLARDPNNDIAVLKINLTGLPAISFGDSGNLQVGQTAIAIGYALGQFDNTVSKGVVSGLSRSISASDGNAGGVEQLRGLIQTDATINPGNSGGPLLDLVGNAIGMNVAMAQGQSIGFAIPINLVRAAFEQVRSSGKITAAPRAFVGVRYVPITTEIQSANHLPYDHGMLITRGENAGDVAVVPGSPADKVGLQNGDIILEADGKQLNEQYLLSDAVQNHKPGDTIVLKVVHKGTVKDVALTLGKQ